MLTFEEWRHTYADVFETDDAARAAWTASCNKGYRAGVQDTRELLAAHNAGAQEITGYCVEGENHCVCGGDLPRVREGCGNWRKVTDHPQPITDAARDVLAERQRQVSVEGWTPEHDDKHHMGEMAIAAGWYALNSPFVGKRECLGDPMDGSHEAYRIFAGKFTAMRWPWDAKWWKPTDQRRDLVKAAALILAEIERLDRAKVE